MILPVLLPDDDLDWARLHRRRRPGPRPRSGCSSRPARALGLDAIATADVVLRARAWPSAADGMRLGRGGGSYDRALGRVPVGTFTCVLLYDDEVGVDVPREPHDRPVTAAATPSGIVRFRRALAALAR